MLLCKRAINPRHGLWTLPAGFLENNETIEQGAFRETLEETRTKVEMRDLYLIFNIPQISQIYMLFLADVIQEDFGQTSESLEVRLFGEDEIPWEQLAFPFVPLALKNYFKDRQSNKFNLKIESIERPVRTSKSINSLAFKKNLIQGLYSSQSSGFQECCADKKDLSG